jgi:hypothetical protein
MNSEHWDCGKSKACSNRKPFSKRLCLSKSKEKEYKNFPIIVYCVCKFEREKAVKPRFAIFTSSVKKYNNFFCSFVRLCDTTRLKCNLQGRPTLRTEASSPQLE